MEEQYLSFSLYDTEEVKTNGGAGTTPAVVGSTATPGQNEPTLKKNNLQVCRQWEKVPDLRPR